MKKNKIIIGLRGAAGSGVNTTVAEIYTILKYNGVKTQLAHFGYKEKTENQIQQVSYRSLLFEDMLKDYDIVVTAGSISEILIGHALPEPTTFCKAVIANIYRNWKKDNILVHEIELSKNDGSCIELINDEVIQRTLNLYQNRSHELENLSEELIKIVKAKPS